MDGIEQMHQSAVQRADQNQPLVLLRAAEQLLQELNHSRFVLNSTAIEVQAMYNAFQEICRIGDWDAAEAVYFRYQLALQRQTDLDKLFDQTWQDRRSNIVRRLIRTSD